MKLAVATIKGVSPYSQGKYHQTPKLNEGKEQADDYERRTWRERMHYDKDGFVFMPPMAFKLALVSAAKYLSEKIPGKKNQTWTKFFTSGILIVDPITLPIKKDDVESQSLFLPADGVPGSSKKVMKIFSVIREWGGDLTVHVLDETITKDVFVRHLEAAGMFIGVGVFRPSNRGYFGRFKVEKVKWSDFT